VLKLKFNIKENKKQIEGLERADVDIAIDFSKRIYKEFGDLIKAVVIFGSNVKKGPSQPEVNNEKQGLANSELGQSRPKKPGDIDLLVIVDDVSVELTPELVETYRIIVKKAIADISERLHVTSLKLSSFWAYIRAGDPVCLNILREGVSLLDAGFFDPLKALLVRGMIRPSPEAVGTYYARSLHTLDNSRWHLLQATIDLYWAVVDSAHAALMAIGLVPPSPEHLPEMIEGELVKKHKMPVKCSAVVTRFYKTYKSITRRELRDIKGADYEANYKEAQWFVNEMREFIKKLKFGKLHGV